MRTLYGALLWSLFLLLAILLHGKEEKRRLEEYRALCRLLSYLRSALLQAPVPLSDIFADFSDPTLSKTEFLSLLREKGFSFALSSKALSVDEEDLLPLKAYAEGLGGRLYTEELTAIDALLAKTASVLAEKEAALPQKRRLTGTLFFSGGMLLLLLLL